jgi:hypothetical protein
MAYYTRPSGIGHAHATLYSTANLAFYVVNGDGSGSTLAGQGGIGGALEALAQTTNCLAFDSEGTGGLVNLVVDGSQWDATSLRDAIREMGSVNGYDFSAATVTAGGQFIVSA